MNDEWWEDREEIWQDNECFPSGASIEQKESNSGKSCERHRYRRRLYIAPAVAVFALVCISEFHYVKHQETLSYTVVEGDTLWDISRRYQGFGFRYVEIVVENETAIDDPDLIYPGEVYRITITEWERE